MVPEAMKAAGTEVKEITTKARTHTKSTPLLHSHLNNTRTRITLIQRTRVLEGSMARLNMEATIECKIKILLAHTVSGRAA